MRNQMILFGLALASALAVSASAQSTDYPGLAPDRPIAERAVTAARIGQQRDAAGAPALLDAIRAVEKATGKKERVFVHVALDALIQSGATLTPTQTLGLARLRPTCYPAILRMVNDEPEKHARTLAAMVNRPKLDNRLMRAIVAKLGTSKPQGLAAALLRHLPPEIEIFVFPGGESSAIGLGGGSGTARGHGKLDVPKDFPAFGHYRFGARGIHVAGRGRRAIHLMRKPIDPGDTLGLGNAYSAQLNGRLRVSALAKLSGIPMATLYKTLARGGSLKFQNAEQYRAEVTNIRDAAVAGYRAVTKQLVDKNLITPAEARTLIPVTRVEIHDCRGKGAKPLPRLDPTSLEETSQEKGPPLGNVKIGRIHWFSDYDRAKAVAKKYGKPLFLHFGENPG